MKKHNTQNYDVDSRFNTLRESYEHRVQSLQEKFRSIEKAIDSDELINTMKSDPTTRSYVAPRIKEIVEEGLLQEKEAQISQVINQLSIMQAENSRLKELIQHNSTDSQSQIKIFEKKLKDISALLEKEQKQKTQICNERDKLNCEINDIRQEYEQATQNLERKYDKERDKLAKDYDVLRKELQSVKERSIKSDSLIRSIQEEYEDKVRQLDEATVNCQTQQLANENLQKENSQLGSEMSDIKSQMEEQFKQLSEYATQNKMEENQIAKLQSTISALEKEKTDLIEKFNAYSKELQSANKQSANQEIEKHKGKLEKSKFKVNSLKESISKKEEELSIAAKIAGEQRIKYENIISELNNEINKNKIEYENKLKSFEVETNKNIDDEKSRCELKIKQTQEQVAKDMENKIKEINSMHHIEISRLKEENTNALESLQHQQEQLNKNSILTTKHQEIVESELKKAKEKSNSELQSLKEECENTFSLRISTMDAQKIKEQEILQSANESAMKTLQTTLDESKNAYNLLYQKHQEILEQKSNLDRTITTLQSDINTQRSALQSIKEKDCQTNQAVSKYEQRSGELELQIKQLKQKLGDQQEQFKARLIEQQDKYKQTVEKMEAFQNNFAIQVSTNGNLKNELEEANGKYLFEQEKCKQLLEKIQSMQNTFISSEKEKKQIIGDYKKKIEENDNEINELQANMAIMRSKESAKLEAEVKSHNNTQTKLKDITNYAQGIEAKYNELLASYKTINGNNEKYLNTLNAINSKSQTLEADNKQLKSKLSQKCKELEQVKENHSSIDTHIIDAIKKLKRDYKNMVISINDEISHYITQSACFAIQAIGNHKSKENQIWLLYQDKLLEETRKMEHSSISIVEKKDQERVHKLDEALSNKNKELQQYQSIIAEEQNKSLEISKKYADINAACSHYQTDIKHLKDEIDSTKTQLKKAIQTIEDLNSQINENENKFKIDLQNVICSTKKEIHRKLQSQLKGIQNDVNSIVKLESNEYRVLLDDIQKLKSEHKLEIEQITLEYQTAITQYESALSIEKNRLNQYKNKHRNMESEISLSNEKKQLIESQLKIINDSLSQQSEKNKRIQNSAETEVINLREQIKSLQEEIDKKDNDIQRIKSDQMKANNMVSDLTYKLKLNEGMAQKEIDEYKAEIEKKCKEIDNLQSILSRSYATLNSSADKMKLASKLNYDTQQLTKKIKEARQNMGGKKESPLKAMIKHHLMVSNKPSPLSVSQLTNQDLPNIDVQSEM